jgi:hypothetical protein
MHSPNVPSILVLDWYTNIDKNVIATLICEHITHHLPAICIQLLFVEVVMTAIPADLI